MDDDLKRIAKRIRSWRDEAGLTLQKLGDKSGVSASTIHKIENLQTVPTIAVLLKVASGLDRRPSELLAEVEENKQVAVHRADAHQTLALEGRATLEHLTSMIPRNRLDYWRVTVEPGAGAGYEGEPWRFNGEMIIVVEEGDVEFDIGGEGYKVTVGDSIHFETSVPHRWYASGGVSATIRIVALIPERMQGDLMTRITTASAPGFSKDSEAS